MIKYDDCLIIIPARGGSKGLPGKNIKPLNGKPLICYTIDAARGVCSDNNICVSTDDDEIISVVKNYGLDVPFVRPLKLAMDNAGSYEVLLHAIDYYSSIGKEFSTIVLLQPTSPLRDANHIKEAISLYTTNLDMVVSVFETKSNPYYVLAEEDEDGFLQKSKEGNFDRRQDCPKVWEYNGAIYVINVNSLKNKSMSGFSKVRKYEMDHLSSVDIDDQLDFDICEKILERRM